jgi:hypothetical protein
MGAPSLYVVEVIENILAKLMKFIPNSGVRVNELGRGEIFYKPTLGEEKKLIEIYGYSERRGESVGNHHIKVSIKEPYLKNNEDLMKFLYEEKDRISRLEEPIKLIIE